MSARAKKALGTLPLDNHMRSSLLRRTAMLMAALSIGVALPLAAAVPAQAQPVEYQSAQSGWWGDPNTWNPPGVPGPVDTATIQPGHEVGLYSAGQWVFRVNVDTLIVNGTLAGAFPVDDGMGARGYPMLVDARMLTNTGQIVGSPGWHSSGGWIWLRGAGDLHNTGTIRAGDFHATDSPGAVGGNVFVEYWNVTNLGEIRGGDRGGWVWITADNNIVNGDALNAATIQGGFGGVVPGVGQYRGGNVVLEGWSVTVGPFSLIQGGHGDEVPNSHGGLAVVIGRWVVLEDDSAVRGGDGCDPEEARVFGANKDIRGTVREGNCLCTGQCNRKQAIVDPPEGQIWGPAEVTGDDVQLAAGNLLTIGPLYNPEAINAEYDIIITVAPGGTLDMSLLTPGTPWLSAGSSVTIQADYIQLPPGANLNDIISAPVITTEYGNRFAHLAMTPSGQVDLAAGQSLDLSVFVANVGNMSDGVQWEISGMEDWWSGGPINRYQTLQPMDKTEELIEIMVPGEAEPGTTSTLYLHASADSGVVVDSEFCVSVWDPSGLLGDLNCDEAVNTFDIDPFVLALTDPGGYESAYPDCDRMLADCDDNGVVNTFDIDPFVALLTGG